MNAPNTQGSAEALAHELAIEQEHVDRVYRRLEEVAESARQVEAESRAKFTTDRSDWLREEDSTALFERDAFAYQAARRLAELDEEHEGLVFGRLDLKRDAETRYIGRLGVRDEDYEPLVIDWRAPAAEPFYRATPSNPMGVIRRRVLRCRDDKVIGIEDDLLDSSTDSQLVIIGEGALMAALSRARGPRMRSIVATIQAEQDEAIRAPYQGVTTIAGGPGTGKTVVALHRAAYLLYTHRKRLERGGVLVVGPSTVFMNYIERVLPGLGEESVTLRSVGHLAEDVLGFGSERDDSAAAATLKGGLVMASLLRRAVQEPLIPQAARQLRVSVKGEILGLDASALARIRKEVLANHKYNQSRPLAERAMLDALWEQLPEELVDLPREAFDDIVRSQAGWTMFGNAWWPFLDPEQVLARLADPETLPGFAKGLLNSQQQRVLLDSLAHARDWQPGTNMPRPDWSISDMALLDELVAMLGPMPVEDTEDQTVVLADDAGISELVTTADLLAAQRTADPEEDPQHRYAHILVDEAQDITPMQWRMLRRRGPQASWTLVGDPAQSSFPDSAETDRAVRDLIGHSPARTYRLSTNYRSPAEVMELAARVIRTAYPAADLPIPVRRTGVEPRLLSISASDLETRVQTELAQLLQDVEGTVGVITPPDRFEQISSALANRDPRVSVLPALQAKGLEYDGVIVVAPDEIVAQTPGGVRVLYVALTRPTQRLITIDLADGAPGSWRANLAEDQSVEREPAADPTVVARAS